MPSPLRNGNKYSDLNIKVEYKYTLKDDSAVTKLNVKLNISNWLEII
jgi:hypothetical protein